jgi:hypothetical protein
MPALVSPIPGQCTRNVVGNGEGNKVTEIIFAGNGVYYASGLRGDNFSKPQALVCVRSWVKCLQSLSPTSLQNAVTVTGNTAELAGGLQLCRAN